MLMVRVSKWASILNSRINLGGHLTGKTGKCAKSIALSNAVFYFSTLMLLWSLVVHPGLRSLFEAITQLSVNA